MEKLCKIYKNPRTSAYRKAWAKAESSPPYIPYVGDILIRLLGLNELNKMPLYKETKFHKFSTSPHKIFTITTNPIKNSYMLPDQQQNNLDSEKKTENEMTIIKKIFLAAFGKIKDDTRQNKCEQDLPWTSREFELARKYFDKWNCAVLRSKFYLEHERTLKNIDPRKALVLDVASWLANCQRSAQQYYFQIHSYAREFLLKARYKEERENFFISLKLEPPKATG